MTKEYKRVGSSINSFFYVKIKKRGGKYTMSKCKTIAIANQKRRRRKNNNSFFTCSSIKK